MQKTVSAAECEDVNPKAFDYCEDMASLSHLSDACVLYNLRMRFKLDLIHVCLFANFIKKIFFCIFLQTISGLFCLTVNPWRWLPLYTEDIMHAYEGHTKVRPPHIYQVDHFVW
jgi:myosin heavy subunit